ncbi:TetR/AcrR family transcriptional regulator [Nocardia goodfellowii]|uniref:AcrR family transcriptional regulator n=1 Tax=Nocardia goodfellowii TaxID=882446 RepID=A0ABS4QNC6_9NOCA|nr:TetR/AcrR family transcriptional regulator [Nocardia goodfellowii]MBP2193210.1 AcrR family transcriptional regulator [Nocardia goodfellowii]
MTKSGKATPTVWERTEGRRGPAPSHSRDDLTAAAIELADQGGLAAVSTRRIAQKLGVSQSALYRYVSGRDDVLDLMVDFVAGKIDLAVPPSGAVIDDLTALAVRAKAIHVGYPWLLDIPVEPLRVGPHGIAYLEYALRAMANVDVPGPMKLQAIAVLNALVQQFARAELGDRSADRSRRIAQAAYLHKTAHQGDHRFLAAALEVSERGAEAPGAMFELMLRRVLEGLLKPD